MRMEEKEFLQNAIANSKNAIVSSINVNKIISSGKVSSGVMIEKLPNKMLGCYNRGTKNISINEKMFNHCFRTNNIKELESTIIHEMLHAIAEYLEPNCGHKGLWKKMANSVTANTEFNISRLCEVTESSYAATLPTIVKYNYIVKCADCGQEYRYQRKSNFYKAVESGNSDRYTCGKCHSPKFIIVK